MVLNNIPTLAQQEVGMIEMELANKLNSKLKVDAFKEEAFA